LQAELVEQCSLLNQQKAELDDDSSQNRLRSQLAELRSKEDRIKEEMRKLQTALDSTQESIRNKLADLEEAD